MRQILLCLIMIFLASATALNTWAGKRHYTFEDDKAWEVITGKWEIKNGEYHQTNKDAQEAIVLLKKSEGIDTADLESISVKAYDLGTGTWQNIFIVFGHDGKSDNYYLGGVFVGGRQGWAFDPIATKDNKRGAEILVAPCDPKCPPEKWFDIRIEFKNGEAILSGGETGGKIKEMAGTNSVKFKADAWVLVLLKVLLSTRTSSSLEREFRPQFRSRDGSQQPGPISKVSVK